MFKKCLKYDFKAVFSIWWIAALTMIILAVPSGLILRNLLLDDHSNEIFPYETLWVFVCYFSIIAFALLTEILIFVRYYSNFFSDEGYLTFTLPVKRSTLFFSKFVTAYLFELMMLLVLIIDFFIVMCCLPPEYMKNVMGAIFGFFSSGYAVLGPWFFVYILEVLIILLLSVASSISMFLIITIGGVLVKKQKLLVTIGLVYASSTVLSILYIPLQLLYFPWALSVSYLTPANPFVAIALILLFFIAVQITVFFLMLFSILGCLERKLNLA